MTIKKLIITLMIVVFSVFSLGNNYVNADEIKPTNEATQEYKVLKVSEDDKVFTGVCGGIAEYFGVDVDAVRATFVLLGLVSGTGVLIYFLLYLVMK